MKSKIIPIILYGLLSTSLIGCSGGSDSGDAAQVLESVNELSIDESKERTNGNEVPNDSNGQNSAVETAPANSDTVDADDGANGAMDKLESIKREFLVLELNAKERFGLEFTVLNGKVQARINRRCEAGSKTELVECLSEIEQGLFDFLNSGLDVLGKNNDPEIKAEIAKMKVAKLWYIKIQKQLDTLK